MKTGRLDLVSFPNPLALESEAENLSRRDMPQKTLDLLHRRVLAGANWHILQGAARQNCLTNSESGEGKENIERNVLKSWNYNYLVLNQITALKDNEICPEINTPGQDPIVKSLIFVFHSLNRN